MVRAGLPVDRTFRRIDSLRQGHEWKKEKQMAYVRIAKGSEDCAMAGMLSNLLETNILQCPVKESIFRALNTVVAIHIEDIEVSITMDFRYGRLVLHEGVVKPPKITIRTEPGYVLDLSNMRMRFGLPNFFDDQGKEIMKNMMDGKIRMFTMPWNLMDIVRLTRVMSVQD